MFTSYVFVELPPKRKNDVFSVSSVVKYIWFNGKAAVLRSKDITLIQKLCTLKSEVAIVSIKPTKGQTVEIMDGPFAGHRGIVKETPEGKNLWLDLLGLSGFFAQITIRDYQEFEMQIVG